MVGIWGLALVTAVAPATGAEDDWDLATHSDGGIGTSNVLLHGSEQVHDLAGRIEIDEDWYFVLTKQYSSYEVRVDGMTGDLDLTPASVQRMSTLGTAVIQNALVTDAGGVLSLPWTHGVDPGDHGSFIKVHRAACGLSCGVRASHRIRFYDTTYTLPRFDNTGSQTTTLLVQNATDRACEVFYVFLVQGGTAIPGPVTLPARGLDVFRTSVLLPGLSGSVRVAHTCGYGGLSGKAVTVDPSTGFAFDTELEHRPH
jgi:hypothetical protein